MKIVFTTLFLTLLSFCIKAQNDTAYVFIDDSTFFSIKNVKKFPNDPDPREAFPFNGGKSYWFDKQSGKWKETCRFGFSNWHPTDEIPYPGFEYQKVHKSILSEKNFKSSQWFQAKTYHEVLNEFAAQDKRIYLIDYSEFIGDSTFMVTVNFSFPAVE